MGRGCGEEGEGMGRGCGEEGEGMGRGWAEKGRVGVGFTAHSTELIPSLYLALS